ncbi:hypothetical protein CC85DRAFT_284735 [Cutaneotrichosporon oleaginosum]|uniref:Uncharacterized protein n=1 Tax=Cutaneotrichosporon oleaginosum TaxID=879819 RepID=A0A0J0XPZ8_9TREE|nr:uncharacterized protein CC85DRAFT_284735 [Cutaneotrichosporon oleaginosum]KLT43178.1 hypothetical protein CC85DRAFT_284735 [Cutaneotrichosporon oleaginosum]TXT09860.1 hypothetical protein COLE_03794 [Cutaneotrichosporon oleaginosum]
MTTPSTFPLWSTSPDWQSIALVQHFRPFPVTAAKELLVTSTVHFSNSTEERSLNGSLVNDQANATEQLPGHDEEHNVRTEENCVHNDGQVPAGCQSEPLAATQTHVAEAAVLLRPRSQRYRRRLPAVLVHRCGPQSSYLGATPLSPASQAAPSDNEDHPLTSVIDTYDTPILQLASSPFVNSGRLDGGATGMLVRLETVTHLINLTLDPEYYYGSSSPTYNVSRIAELNKEYTEGRRHVDVALDPFHWGRAAVVDEGGGVWMWWEEKDRGNDRRLTHAMKLLKLRSPVSDPEDGFFRVAFGVRPDTLLILSRDSVVQIDTAQTLTSNHRSATLLSLRDPTEKFSAIERTASLRGGVFTYVCTNKHVMWIDQHGGAQNPLLRWRHDMGGEQDETLQLVVISSRDVPHAGGETVLVQQPSSGRVHGVLGADHGLAALVSEPWALSAPQTGRFSTLHAFAPPAHEKGRSIVTLVALGDKNISVGEMFLTDHDAVAGSSGSSPTIFRASEVPKLATEQTASEAPTPTAPVKDWVIPARWAWLSINDDAAIPSADVGEMKAYFMDPEENMKVVTTRAELAHAACSGPLTVHPHILNSINYDESFSASDIASVPLSSHFAYSATTGTLLGDAPGDLSASPPEEDQGPAARRLRSDLLLSSKIVYPTDPLPREDVKDGGPNVDDLFAEATGQLSLTDRVPDLSFAVLPPPPRVTASDYHEHSKIYAPSRSDMSTAHALLRDWKLGADPLQYEWTPSEPSASLPPLGRSVTSPPPRQFSPRPPYVSAPRPVSPLPRLHAQSSPVRRFPVSSFATQTLPILTPGHRPASPTVPSDPDVFPHTQIERGAYGARPEASAKVRRKPIKRRHGF